MRLALEPLQARFGFELEIVDVDADPVVLAHYDELVPVLAAPAADGGSLQLCHYFLDVDGVATYLAAHTGKPAG